jgi:hypothetical protein
VTDERAGQGDQSAADVPGTGENATAGTKQCALPGCPVWFTPASNRQQYCRPEHAADARRDRRRMEDLGVADYLTRLEHLREDVLRELVPEARTLATATTTLTSRLDAVTGSFTDLLDSAAARVAAAEADADQARQDAAAARDDTERLRAERDAAQTAAARDRAAAEQALAASAQDRAAAEAAEQRAVAAERDGAAAQGAHQELQRELHDQTAAQQRDHQRHDEELARVRTDHTTAVAALREQWDGQRAEHTRTFAEQERRHTQALDNAVAAARGSEQLAAERAAGHLRDAHNQRVQEQSAAHAEAIQTLLEQRGAAQHRADTAETRAHTAEARLHRLRQLLRQAPPTPTPAQDAEAIVREVGALLDETQPPD